MAKKRKVYLHVGPTSGPGDFLEAALLQHRHALAELGVRVPVEQPDELFRAALEMTRSHKDWGFKRREVEGTWAGLCRRILKAKGRDHVALSMPLLADATPEQIDLLVDQLPGTAVHVVVVAETGSPEAPSVLARWERAVTKPERLHLLEVGPGQGCREVWAAYGDLLDFGTASLSVADLPSSTPATLGEALATVARLSRRNASLELQLAEAARKRTKLKRRLAAA